MRRLRVGSDMMGEESEETSHCEFARLSAGWTPTLQKCRGSVGKPVEEVAYALPQSAPFSSIRVQMQYLLF